MNALTLSLCVVCSAGVVLAADRPPMPEPSQKEDRKIDNATGQEVGRASVEGITVSGGRTFVTRDHVTEELKKELVLDNGTRILPDGTIRVQDGRELTLRDDQVLGFDGTIVRSPILAPIAEGPVNEPAPMSGAPAASTSTTRNVGVAGGGAVVGGGTVSGAGGGIGDGSSNFVNIPSVVAAGTASANSGALTATQVTRDPRTGQLVFSAVNPATGELVSTTIDSRTGEAISTTTVNGRRVSSTTDPRTGLPVTITTDSSGRISATSIDPRTGLTVPVQYNPQTGQVTFSGAGTGTTPGTMGTTPATQGPTTTPTQQIPARSGQTTTTEQLGTQQVGTQQPGSMPSQQPATNNRPSTNTGTSTGGGTTGGGTSGGSTGGGR